MFDTARNEGETDLAARLLDRQTACLLVVGGSDSGKSAVAEAYATAAAALQKEAPIYLATMRCDGEAAADKIRKHRAMRANKGFETIEQPTLDEMLWQSVARRVVLLEDLGNLVANELFSEDRPTPQGVAAFPQQWLEDAVVRITDRCLRLAQQSHLIIVSNDLFRDGQCFDDATEGYKLVLAGIHRRLAKQAEVIEVTAGLADNISAKARQTADQGNDSI